MEEKGKIPLKALPFQIIDTPGKIILKRGVEQLIIPDNSVLLIIKVIQEVLIQSPMCTDDISLLFAGHLRPLVIDFVNHLIGKRFLVPLDDSLIDIDNETPQNIFYWHFNKQQKEISKILNEKTWIFVGVNKLTSLLITAIMREGFHNVIVVDDPSLRNIIFFDDNNKLKSKEWGIENIPVISSQDIDKTLPIQNIGFIIAASEFGSQYLLLNWNKYALNHGIPFYPVLLQNFVGYSGPLVILEEAACLQCLRARQNSTTTDFEEKRLSEEFAFEGQNIVAYHSSMLLVLAEISSFEILKFKANIQWELGSMLEINLLSGGMDRRKLLKDPRCPVCSGLKIRPLTNVHKQLASPDSWNEIEQVNEYVKE